MKQLLLLLSFLIAVHLIKAQVPYDRIDSICQTINTILSKTNGHTYYSGLDKATKTLSFPEESFTVSVATRLASNVFYVEVDGVEKLYLTENVDLSKAAHLEIAASEDKKMYIVRLYFIEGYLKNRVFINGKETTPLDRNFLEFFINRTKVNGWEDAELVKRSLDSLCHEFQIEKKLMTKAQYATLFDDVKEIEEMEEKDRFDIARLDAFTNKYPYSVHALRVREMKEKESNREYTLEESPASFPGGESGWREYLQKNLDASVPLRDKAPPGIYRVKVQFNVDKEGYVSNVKAIEEPEKCPSCVREAIRIIQRGPKWIPAEQNGRKLVQRMTQTIAFRAY